MIELFSRDLGGQGPPLIVLHGLFGSSANWATMGRRFGVFCHAHALDLRNHGRSPHAPRHTIADLPADVLHWMDGSDLENVWIVGHSMGGQTAMALALAQPDRVRGVIIVDIAPRGYDTDYTAELEALSVRVSEMTDRAQIDRAMAVYVGDAAVRQFLQMNLERTATGFSWRLNVPALRASRGATVSFSSRYSGPSLFVVGGRSTYVGRDDHHLIREHFPTAMISKIDQADHWVHYSQPDTFFDQVQSFVTTTESGRDARACTAP